MNDLQDNIDIESDVDSEEEMNELAASEQADSDTLTFKRSHVYATLILLAFVVGLAVGYLFWGRGSDAPPKTVAAPAAPQEAEETRQITRYDVDEDDDPVFGPADAAITIIEFSDYECPYCRRWHEEVLPGLLEAYPDQIRLVFRDFPLTSIHPNATPAASAANCARDQEQFWAFNQKLFSMEYSLSKSGYQIYADELGLDMDVFNECLESGRYNDEVQADLDYAVNLGVRSTPTFFVNGIPIVGAQPLEAFSQLIDQELAGEIP